MTIPKRYKFKQLPVHAVFRLYDDSEFGGVYFKYRFKGGFNAANLRSHERVKIDPEAWISNGHPYE